LAAPAETAAHFGEALVEQASLMSLKYPRSGRCQDPAMVIMEEPVSYIIPALCFLSPEGSASADCTCDENKWVASIGQCLKVLKS